MGIAPVEPVTDIASAADEWPTTGWAYRVSAPYVFEVVQEPVPQALASGELLVELTAGAVCGSDLPVARGAVTPAGGPGQAGRPLHEVVGRVVATSHPDFSPGMRVVGWAAKEDALRQYFVTTGARVDPVRMDVSDAHATTAQSVACLMTTFERLGPLEGRSVGIVGLGPFGLMASVIAKARGAGRIVGIDPVDRTTDAASLPLDEVITASSRVWAQQLRDQDRPDVVLEMVGHQASTLADAMNAVARKGTVVAFGVPDDDWYGLPLNRFFRHNGTLVTGVTTDHRAMLHLAQDFLVANPWFSEFFVTHVFAGTQVQEAFSMALQPKPGQRKVVIDFQQ